MCVRGIGVVFSFRGRLRIVDSDLGMTLGELPNGFQIAKSRLRAILVDAAPTHLVCSRMFGARTAGELLGALEGFPLDEVVVHRDVGLLYTIRLDPGFDRQEASPGHWFEVGFDSPIYSDLQAEHRLWVDRLPARRACPGTRFLPVLP